MNCASCFDHDGSEVVGFPIDNGLYACRGCISRDGHSVLDECGVCKNVRLIPAEWWLEDDVRCNPCANKEAREVADADAGVGYTG